MRLGLLPAIALLGFAAPPVLAQDLPTDQLQQHAEVVRHDMVLKKSLRHSIARRDARARRATPQQVAACARKAQFRRQYGARNPKVQKLYSLCRGVGL